MRFRLVVHPCSYVDLLGAAVDTPHPHHADPVLHACDVVRLQSCSCGGARLAMGYFWHRVPLTCLPGTLNDMLGLAVHEMFADLDSRRLFWIGLETYRFDMRSSEFLHAAPHTYVEWDVRGVAVRRIDDVALAFFPRTPVASRDVCVTGM